MSKLQASDRQFHAAYLEGKLPCPHLSCRRELRNEFFQANGLSQHFRAKHSGETFEDKYINQARRLLRMSHGQETKNYLENMSAARRNQVCRISEYLVLCKFFSSSVILKIKLKFNVCFSFVFAEERFLR